MASIDANIVLRLILHDVPDQTFKIKDLLSRSKPKSLIVEDVVLFECVWVLEGRSYNLSRLLISKLLLQLAGTPQISCNRDLLEKVTPLYIGTASISFIDICLVEYAKLSNAVPLLTFDKKLARAFPKIVSEL